MVAAMHPSLPAAPRITSLSPWATPRRSLLQAARWLALAIAWTLMAAPVHAERVRDLGAFQGVRSNQLTGYGIVVGLDGTGDDNLEYLTQAM